MQFTTPSPIAAVLDIAAGRIHFIASERADTTVEVRPADASKSRDVKAAEEVTVEFTDGVLRIQGSPAGNKILGNTGSVEVTVQLPAGSRVDAKAASAVLGSTGPLGEVSFEGALATVKLGEVAGARLALQDGEVFLGRLNGSAEITTQRGNLTVGEAVSGTVTLNTQHGEISVGAARGVSASLYAGTTYGRINNSLNNTDGPNAALSIHATTSYGDINAHSV